MLSAVIRNGHSYRAVPLAGQLVHHWSAHPGPLVLGATPRNSPAPTLDRDRHLCYTASWFLFPLAPCVAAGVRPYLLALSRVWRMACEDPTSSYRCFDRRPRHSSCLRVHRIGDVHDLEQPIGREVPPLAHTTKYFFEALQGVALDNEPSLAEGNDLLGKAREVSLDVVFPADRPHPTRCDCLRRADSSAGSFGVPSI